MKSIKLGKVSVDQNGLGYFPARYNQEIYLLPLHNAGNVFTANRRHYLKRELTMRDTRRNLTLEGVNVAKTITHVPRYSNPYNEGFDINGFKFIPALIGEKYLFVPLDLLKVKDMVDICADGGMYDSITDFIEHNPDAQPIRWEV